MSHLDGRCAIVTGAAQGLGNAIAARLLADGATVIGADIQAAKLADAAAQFASHGARFATVAGDVSKSDTAAAIVRRALEAAGRLEILVNCAGGSGMQGIKDIEDIGDEVWDSVLASNLRASFVMSRAAVPAMRRAGRGRIVNFSSNLTRGVSAPLGTVGARLAYCAAKGGIEAFTRQLARDLGPAGITVNAVVPGFILTEPGARVRQKFDELEPATQALLRSGGASGTPGQPADIAAAVAFLCSDEAAQINGVLLTVGG
jgi:NAD(P)-dependent dehydrogenase (short-subunit alcohol dehydrogenase family)